VTVLVAAAGVEVHMGSAVVLPPTDIEVRSGEVLVVHGPSGSGKTTLLGLLAGWFAPTTGTLRWTAPFGSGAPWRWHLTAVVPQALALLPELSLLENVAVAHRLRGAAWRDASSAARASLGDLGIADLVDRRPEETSLGQQQRAAVARALTVGPPLVLADEPTSHLDADATALVLAELRATAAADSAVVIASHDPAILELADRTLAL
jgi:ABC-type lipoprotein export system ATPase subunit